MTIKYIFSRAKSLTENNHTVTTLLRKVHIRQLAATYCAVFLLLVSTAEADKAEDSGALWNKVDQLIVDCDTAQSFGNESSSLICYGKSKPFFKLVVFGERKARHNFEHDISINWTKEFKV